MKKFLAAGILMLSQALTHHVYAQSDAQSLPIVPFPREVQVNEGSAPLSVTDNITYITDASLQREGYRLSITAGGVTITSATESGKFYALQSLEQLKLASQDGTLPLVEITDYPLLEYRSFMLDCSRHFFSKDAVKRILRIMSFYKINFFHWHLNDDQGWRVEIPEYPLLTEKGSIRKASLTLKDNPFFYDDTEYGRGCYYTLDDLREVVEYAQSLNIEIIPEYDLPGHNMAAIASYPELSCNPEKSYEVRVEEGVSTDVLNVGDDRVIDFLKCVLGHLAEVFPSKYIHLGGDECPTTVWQSNAQCQQRIKNEGLSSVNDLQPWLLEKLGSWLRDEYGKQVVAWDELVEHWNPNYTIKPIIMCYSNASYADRARKAADKGLRSVMTPTTPCYFDQMQCSTTQAEFDEIYQGGYGANWVNNLQNVYAFDPLSAYGERTDYCFGTQGSLWTEACVTEAEMQYQFLPRMLAVAENGWLPADLKNWDNFLTRIQAHDSLLDSLGYAHGKHYFTQPSLTALQKCQREAKHYLDETLPGQTGYASAEVTAALQAALDDSYAEGATYAPLNSAINTFKKAELTMPTDGGLYQIRSASLYYLQRYAGSSLYCKNGQMRIHYTPQNEPEEMWVCKANADGTSYTFSSLVDGTEMTVGGRTTIFPVRAQSKDTKATYGYDPGVLLLRNLASATTSARYLYANADGTVTEGTEKKLNYPSSWRLVEVTSFRPLLQQLQTKCERLIEAWKPDTYGYASEEAITFLREDVVQPIDARLKDDATVTRAEYEAFVALYSAYLQMPVASFLDTIDEGCYYQIQNAYFTNYYAVASGSSVVPSQQSSTDASRWCFVKAPGNTVRIYNKSNGLPAAISASTEGTSVTLSSEADATKWILNEVSTDLGSTGITIQDPTATYSWYTNPSAFQTIVLKPKDWGASIWNFIKIANDPTGIAPTAWLPCSSDIYDLCGRKVTSIARHGIYIQNGHKVMR